MMGILQLQRWRERALRWTLRLSPIAAALVLHVGLLVAYEHERQDQVVSQSLHDVEILAELVARQAGRSVAFGNLQELKDVASAIKAHVGVTGVRVIRADGQVLVGDEVEHSGVKVLRREIRDWSASEGAFFFGPQEGVPTVLGEVEVVIDPQPLLPHGALPGGYVWLVAFIWGVAGLMVLALEYWWWRPIGRLLSANWLEERSAAARLPPIWNDILRKLLQRLRIRRKQNESFRERQQKLEHTNRDLERALRRSQETGRESALRLKEENRFQERFLAQLSHDFRTPLTGIRSAIDLLADRHEPLSEATQDRLMAHIKEQSGRLERLVERVMHLERFALQEEPVLLAPLDVHGQLQGLVSDLDREVAGAGLQILLDPQVGKKHLLAEGSAKLIRAVFLELVRNAIRFTPPGGVIQIGIDIEPESRWILVKVQDSGVGIELDRIDKVMQTGVTPTPGVRPGDQGRGGGLTRARRSMQKMGGELKLVSQPGRGTRVEVWLPGTAQSSSEQ
ncbi:MAG: hypothetical protein COX57_08380 [Alphaproteobacteria bacterium CG_4_10_14_0_2_um_filter_63_37]|nr:MAG: hypothetical protein AUJ55_07555 [Proteobacteria bacterium CG1_02_64_396]PJA24467.1 MAG: hypothetical protein COX57_08380 [Alphaproteobacteria bacterium CG_4_10_14_0_2_um_filter_63_37]